ncbi:MAG TPA: MBL fold metallo-hydrolase [Bacillus bacterium]|uniref:MBL fold metallo-hydrolase n=1 Tax=Siminovitchia fordii TaxID=254759 RepID=A0ABQ4K262_9BACI|nr:MBL fold metallo-hydrolase [Siminovitchia fordii]GIN19202.1 MBL fold metallo-hydrolase [Siminovitchia fordii]HBZ10196.1 MBL fold metallo-hydrolase [Bacillus sp. (in: firmicutes)]
MELREISDCCYYFCGAVNIGYIHKDGKGLLIDSGIDKGTAKKILNILKGYNLPIDYVFLTHAHTDHYGGASFLQKQQKVKLHAPRLEAAIMEHPILEPIYLWNGAMPIKQLRNKFLEGEPVIIDGFIHEGRHEVGPFRFEAVHLPGHSYSQMGIIIGEILYAADSYFGPKVLAKHKVPFIVDADATIHSLEKLQSLVFRGALPGHGDYEADISETIQANINCHTHIKQFLLNSIIMSPNGISMEVLLGKMFDYYGLKAREIGQWLLFRTSFTAYITSLIENGDIAISINGHTPWLKGESP